MSVSASKVRLLLLETILQDVLGGGPPRVQWRAMDGHTCITAVASHILVELHSSVCC